MPTFVDTNVLVYARDASDAAKQERAARWVRHLWEEETGRISFQVLHEYYMTTTRKLRPGLSPEAARSDVRDLLAWDPVAADGPLIESAWSIEQRFDLSFWDAMIVASAHATRCDVLLTEDLQHGADLDGVTVMDPFQAPLPSPSAG